MAAGERAYLLSSHTGANGTARAEGPPGAWHVILSETQEAGSETVSGRQKRYGVAPENVLSLEVPPHKVYEVNIRRRTAFDKRVDAEKRKSILQTTTPHNIPAGIHMLQVVIQLKMVAAEIERVPQSVSPLE